MLEKTRYMQSVIIYSYCSLFGLDVTQVMQVLQIYPLPRGRFISIFCCFLTMWSVKVTGRGQTELGHGWKLIAMADDREERAQV